MRLGDCLLQADTLLLRDIATAYELPCSRFSKTELITTILHHFRENSFVCQALNRIEDRGVREACVQLALYPRSELSKEEMDALVIRANSRFPSKKPLLPRLIQQGWVYRVGMRQSLYKYIVPDEIRTLMQQALISSMQQQVTVVEETPVIWREETGALLRDISTFLRFGASQNIKITVDGTIFKKQFSMLMELFEIQEVPESSTGWRFGYGRRFHQYPDRFAFIYDYCYLRALIEEDLSAGVLRVTNAGLSWDQKSAERLADILKAYRLLYRRPIPRLGFIISTILAICSDRWVTTDSLKKIVLPYLETYYSDNIDILFERRIVGMLVHLGVLAQGSLTNGVHVVKALNSSGHSGSVIEEGVQEQQELDPQLFIQPNFEILVPKEFVDHFTKDLEDIADLKRVDIMRVYRMSKQTIVRAVKAGWMEHHLLDFLMKASGGLVPINVKRMIQNWMEEYGKVTLYKTAVMECRSVEVAEEILQLPGIKNEVWGRIGDRHLLVREEAFEHVADSLEKLGYLPDVW